MKPMKPNESKIKHIADVLAGNENPTAEQEYVKHKIFNAADNKAAFINALYIICEDESKLKYVDDYIINNLDENTFGVPNDIFVSVLKQQRKTTKKRGNNKEETK